MQISVEGKLIEAAAGVSCAEVLKQALSGKRFKAALACRVKTAETETLLDLSAEMPADAVEAAPVTVDETEGLQLLRHSTSHVMAAAVQKLFPGVKVTVSVPEELLMVPMDAILIEQVLANLMENAVSHGQTTTCIRLSVSVEGNDAVFSIQDDGKGIPPEQIPNLFTGISHSSDNRTVDGKRNMGLGLTVCKAIVQAHGGTILGRNLPQGGAEFAFRLPLTNNKEVTQ